MAGIWNSAANAAGTSGVEVAVPVQVGRGIGVGAGVLVSEICVAVGSGGEDVALTICDVQAPTNRLAIKTMARRLFCKALLEDMHAPFTSS